ncbi:MAG: tRNA uridine-5-carboxymethylaminomethyl(34) synthesis GTPase MnmE [Kiritimatiellae bacterium]|nr:tRNA uridine-5-carboxymethylaminomethyl(34) synthesis GTPase MnmE [Kiritimatiellia bacterium]
MADTGNNASGSPIAALATASGAAGICVVRVSGEGALEVGDRLVQEAARKPSRRAAGAFFHASILHPQTRERIDDAVVLVYRAPHSYTGEDTLEIQGHGGSLPSRRLLDAVLAAGARMAEPGEFTKRAFLNGRLDLTQAEAVCDFIQAKTDRAAHVARAQMDGALGQKIGHLYGQLTCVCADVEHVLDFDEGELPDTFLERIAIRLSGLVAEAERLAATWNEGHLLRDGALVVISGRPNAGKSSLLNALLGRNRAIVHEVPGTTRDVIEEGFVLNGIPLRLVDTAGLRETDNAVEREGIGRARELMRQADLNLHVIDWSQPCDGTALRELAAMRRESVLVVLNKKDLPPAPAGREVRLPEGVPHVQASLKTGEGLAPLRASLAALLGIETESQGQPVVTLRHLSELRLAVERGRLAVEALAVGADRLVIAAGALREAAEALGRIVGRVYTDDLLDTVFNRFCVGK